MNRTVRKASKDETFFEELRRGLSISKAASAAGYSRTQVYNWRADDPEFHAAIAAAVEQGTDRLEDEAFRRAHDGVPKEIYYKGDVVGVEQSYSDTVLMFLLKARRPDKYKDRTEVGGPDGAPLIGGITVNFVKPEAQDNGA